VPDSERLLVLLVSPEARRPGRTAKWAGQGFLFREVHEADVAYRAGLGEAIEA
jgi:hypothetical protein